MRIAIYGAGAVGGHLAARLALARQDVSVIARGAHLDAMRARGLILRTAAEGDRAAKINATDRPADCGPQDAVFVTVKAYSLSDISEYIRPLIALDTLVVFAQNGMPWWYPLGLPPDKPRPPNIANFALAESFLSVMSADRIAGAVVDASSEIVEPGVIRNSSNVNRLTLASIDDRIDPTLSMLQRAVTEAGYASPVVPAIREVVWLKLLRNMSTSPIAMATQNKSSVVLRDPALGEIFLRMVNEGMSIARAAGYPMNGMTSPEKMLAATTDVTPSLLQDFRLGRRLEIDALLYAPLAFARAAGLATPTIDAIAAIVRRLAEDKGLM